MPARNAQRQTIQILEEAEAITLAELTRTCRVHTEWVVELAQEGVVEPLSAQGPQWRFAASSIVRIEKARRLQRDLGLNMAGIALALQLLDKIEVLEARLKGTPELSRPEDTDTD